MTTPTPPTTPVLSPDSDTGVSNTDGITRDTAPIITGTATPGDTVTLLDSDGTTALGIAQADSTTGAWSITSASLTEGTHTLTATDTDSDGNTSAASDPLSVTIDITAPAAPATPALDSSVPNTNGTTQDTTPTITGTATPGDTVTLLDTDGTTVLGTAIADSTTGAWSILSAPLAGGAHTLTATDTDTAGNTSVASGTLSVTIQNVLALDPASDTGVSNTDGITRDTTPTITGTATAGDTVTLLDTDGTTVLGTAIADSTTGDWSIVSAPLAEGAHILSATDTNSVGNISAAYGSLSVTIDTTVPATPATPVLDPASDTGVSNTDGITQNTTPTITGTATAGDTVTLLDTDGITVLGTAIADSTTGDWSIVSAPLAEGAHTLTVTDSNMAGDISAASGALAVTIDTTVPATPATPGLGSNVPNSNGTTPDTTPTITGTATAGDTVTLLDTDGTALGTAIADSTTGAWSILSAPLAVGAHTLTATDTDMAGNISAASGALSVTIDTTVTIPPATPVLDPASDTGVSNSDGITRGTTPTITGTATPGDTVTLLDTDGTTVLGIAQADSTTGDWSIVSAPLTEGTHTLTATASDQASNTSAASSALSVTIDTTAPAAPATPTLNPADDTGVSNTDGIIRDTTPTITGTATAGDTVTLLDTDGTTVLGTAIADSTTGAWLILSAPLSEGTHILTATDTDAAGNISAASASLSVTIDITVPATPATPVLDPASDTGVSNTDGITRDTTPTITGTATAGDTVTLLDTDGTTVLGTAIASNTTGAWSIISAPLAEGAHTLTITDSNTAGNISAVSSPLSVTIDTTVPATPATPVLDPASDTGVSNTDGITQNTTPTITGTATAGDTVTLLDTDGITVLGTAIADSTTGDWSIVSAPLAEGAHTLTVTDSNMAGDISAASGALAVTIDTTVPATPATPGLGSNVPNSNGTTPDTTPTITGTATAGDTVTLLDTDGTALGTAIADSTTGAWSILSAPLAVGAHTLTATDTDMAGNISAASGALSVTIDTTVTIPPATPVLDPASDTGVSNSDGITRGTTPTITGTATPGDTVTLLDTDGTTALGTAIADSTTGDWSIVSAPLIEGPHTLTATDTDTNGNTSAASGSLSVTIDTTAPSTPATPILNPASDTGVSNTDDITRDTTPIFTGIATPGDSITLLDTNSIVRGRAQADVTGAWSIVSAPLSEGTHTFTVTDTDMAGNTSAASGVLSVTIDTTMPAAPPAPVFDPSVSNTNGITQDTTPTIIGTATPGDTVTLMDTGGTTVLGTAIADSTTGAWSIVSAPLAVGAHTLTATDSDKAGNTSVVSGVLSVTINTTVPVITPPNNPGVTNTAGIAAFDTSTGQSISVVPQAYSGPVSGIQSEFINITNGNLNITVTTPNWFLHSGNGNDALAVTSGNNILDGGGGSNFLTGGTGSDTFFVDARGASASIWSTVVNFHASDSVTMWGVSPANFIFDFEDSLGATGYTGLTLHAISPNNTIFSVTFSGLTKAALSNGTISETFGIDPVSGSTYTNFRANH